MPYTGSENQSAAMGQDVKYPSVAIVILNWNGKSFLQQFIPSVLASVYPNKRVIVADNGSSDDSVSFLQQSYPTVEIIYNKHNYGFAGGYNLALQQIQSDYYVLLNSDVEVNPNWIGPVMELMEANRNIAACQPKILAFNDKEKFEYAGASGGWLDHFGYPFMRGRVFEDCETDQGQYNDAQPCFWASGAAMFVRAATYHEMGGLDSSFFAHQEEIDLCWRLQLAGYTIYVQPASVVYHVGGGTLPRGNSRKTFLNFRNNLIMLAKNLPLSAAIWKIPVRFFLDILSAGKGLLTGDGGYFLAIARAHLHFIGWLMFRRKQSLFPVKRGGTLRGWYKGSVVWAYFAQGKKAFSEIVGNK
ncbi:MAG: glycosyltransferase family 2 protein [Sphingobacteriales bacterium]|nr:glycosyltransferase family 2 protein [Sphingobacteriales bacterium]